jgi:signal transduction histidine kinase
LRTLGLTLGVGLLLLYAALLPIAVRATRDIRRQNERLNELLEREHANVEELRAASRKKDDFVAAVSHELRTPLTSIIGYLATLQQPAFADDANARAEFLTAADVQAKRLLRLITNVLTAAELDDGARPMVLERIDLAQMTSELAAGIPGGQGRVDVSIDPGAAFVVSDRSRLAEILTNLVDNALKYSNADDRVDVAAACTESGGIVISVRDRGIGISPEGRESLFDRFRQGDQSSTRRYGGLGLGLHLVRSMVEDLGGVVDVRDADGPGTAFVVTLPALEPDTAASAVTAVAASRPASTR